MSRALASAAALAAATPQDLMTLYPGTSLPVAQAVHAVRRGELVDFNQFNVARTSIYHRIQLMTNGTAQTNNQLTFFGAQGPVIGTSNWYGSSGLPADTVAFVRGVRYTPEFGITAAGAMSATTFADNSVNTTLPVAAINWLNYTKYLLSSGEHAFKIGNRTIFNVWAAGRLPAGRGPNFEGAIASTPNAAAGSAFSLAVNNGVALADNLFSTNPWPIILPNKPVTLTGTWQSIAPAAGLSFTGVDLWLCCEMDVILVQNASL